MAFHAWCVCFADQATWLSPSHGVTQARQDHIDMATAAYKRLELCVYMYADGFDRAAAEEYIKPKKS